MIACSICKKEVKPILQTAGLWVCECVDVKFKSYNSWGNMIPRFILIEERTQDRINNE